MLRKQIKQASAFLFAVIAGLGLLAHSTRAQADPDSGIDPLNSNQFYSCQGSNRYEVNARLPLGYALTGIAVRAHSDEVRTVRLIGRRVLPNGTLGERVERGFGARPSADTELQVETPAGHVIVAIAGDIDRRGPASQDFSHLKISFQAIGLENGKVRLTGPVRDRWANNNQGSVEATCFQSDLPRQSVITGVAMRESGDSLTGLGVYYGQLQ